MLEIGPLLRTIRRRPGIWALLVLEIAVGVTTIGSLLFSGAWFGEGGAAPTGFDESELILVSTYTPSDPALPSGDGERRIRAREAADRELLRALPDIEAATGVTNSILDDRWSYPSLFTVPAGAGAAAGAPAPSEAPGWVVYSDGQLARALGLRFVAGGMPAAAVAGANADGDRPAAAVLTRGLAALLFPDPRAAVGVRVSCDRGNDVLVTGVVEDVSMRMALMPHHQHAAFLFGGAPMDHEARIIARARAGRRAAALHAVAAALAPVSSGRHVDVRAFDSSTGAHHRIGVGLLRLLGAFGAMVVLVVLLGALAATSFLVAQRTRQIGIRRALGATRGDIVTFFLVESAIAAAIGSIIGVVSTSGLFVLMREVFHAIRFRPALLLLALAALWTGSIVATLIPALRAARVPPSVAGRSL